MHERIARVRQLLDEIHHVSVATVNADGSPHNSPVFMAFDGKLIGYWASNPETQHSQNIMRDGRVFLAVFDSREGYSGLYIAATATVLESETDAMPGYRALQSLKERLGGAMGDMSQYLGAGSQRIYCATPKRLWINESDKDPDGVVLRDRRLEIALDDLI